MLFVCSYDIVMEGKRAPNFTSEEIDIILNFIKERPELISGNLGGAYKTPFEIRKTWEELTDLVNSSGISGHQRKSEEIKKKWKDLKHISKKKAANYKSQMMKTGGGPPPKELSHIQSSVMEIIGTKCIEGIGGYDTCLMKENRPPELGASNLEDTILINNVEITDLYPVQEADIEDAIEIQNATSVENRWEFSANSDSRSTPRVQKHRRKVESAERKNDDSNIEKLVEINSGILKELQKSNELKRQMIQIEGKKLKLKCMLNNIDVNKL